MMKWKANLETAYVDRQTIGFGVVLYCLFDRSYPCPIGLVWGIPLDQTFHVYHSYTPVWARRQGVRSKINEAIFKDYQAIESGESSLEAGVAFMRATGYQFDRKRKTWRKVR